MDKPIHEAVLDRACAAYAAIADDCMGLVRRKAMQAALTAAQQQGQAAAEVVQEADGVNLRFVGPILPAGTKLYTAPPSAPVGVDLSKLQRHVWSSRGWEPDPKGPLVQFKDLEALAQQPAAVDEAMVMVQKHDALILADFAKTHGGAMEQLAARRIATLATRHQEPTT